VSGGPSRRHSLGFFRKGKALHNNNESRKLH